MNDGPNGAEPLDEAGDEFELDLACSSCNADLSDDDQYRVHRVCGSCGRHYWLPARERIDLLVDAGSFTEIGAELVSVDPLLLHDRLPVPDRLAESREQPAAALAIVTGTATIAGNAATVVALDLAVIGSSIGIIAGEKIAAAMEHAVTRRLPVIVVCSGGSSRAREGVLALAQVTKLANAVTRLRRVGVPFVALLTHPTSGNALVGLANLADIVLAEPGAQMTPARINDPGSLAEQLTSEALAALGMVDQVIPRDRQRAALADLLDLLARRSQPAMAAFPGPAPTTSLPAGVEAGLLRDPRRPTARAYIERIATGWFPVRGDRLLGDDPGVLGGICRIDDAACVLIGVERGAARLDVASYAKVIRLLLLAAHLELPVVSLLETDRAADACNHQAAQGMSRALAAIVASPVPVVAVGIGEIAGMAGTSLFVGDRMLLQEHALLAQAPGDPVATARDCLRLGLIEAIVAEPEPSAAAGPEQAAIALRIAVGGALAELAAVGPRRLLDDRARKLRQLGLSTEAGREIALKEVRELQDLQRLLERSIGDLRQRLEHRIQSLPTLQGLPAIQRPAISLPRIHVRKPALGDLAQRVAAARRVRQPDDPDSTSRDTVDEELRLAATDEDG